MAMPIVLSKDEWSRIVKWTDKNKESADAMRRKEYVKYLNDASAAMTKTWPNSLENVNKRNEEMRRARAENAEKVNAEFYKRYIKRKKEEETRMMYTARDTIFKNKDASKLLLGAVVETVVLKERAEQVKFNEEFLRRPAVEQKRQEDEEIIRKAKEWHENEKKRRQRRFEKNKEHQKDLIKQIETNEETKRREFESELEMQKQDVINSIKEIEFIREFEENFKQAEKARILADNERSLKETEQRRAEALARDEMDDQLIEVLQRSQDRIVCLRKQADLEARKKILVRLDKVSKQLATGTADRDAKEQANLERALKEKEIEIEARHKAELEKLKNSKRERLEARQQYLQSEAQKLHEEHTKSQWALINRFKNEEIYKAYKEKMAEEKQKKTLEYRDLLLKQQEEIANEEKRKRAEERYFYGELAEKKLRDADNKLLTHAAALLEEAEKNGRPTLPIRKVIDSYCRLYRLYPMPDLPKSLQEHFQRYAPRDGTKPDPNYKEPPEPPPVTDDYYFSDIDDPTPRDGLQEPPKAGPSKKETETPKKHPNSPVDYKRQGRADGMQVKPVKSTTPTLPPIEKCCICHLKDDWGQSQQYNK